MGLYVLCNQGLVVTLCARVLGAHNTETFRALNHTRGDEISNQGFLSGLPLMRSHSLHQIEACSDLQSQNSRRLGRTPLTPRGFPSPAVKVYTEAVSQWDKEVVSRALMQISIRTRCGDRRKMLMKICRRGVGYSGPGGTIVWKQPRGGLDGTKPEEIGIWVTTLRLKSLG